MVAQPIGDDLAEDLDKLLAEAVEHPEKLTEWEQGFVDDQVNRLDAHWGRTLMTAKQWEIIERIREKLAR